MNSIKPAEVRKFGLIALIFFGLLFALGLWRDKAVPTYFFGLLAFCGICFTVLPQLLIPVYKRWMALAHFMSRVLTVIVMTFTFFLVITPSGLLKRVFGGTPIRVDPDKSVKSYWVDRNEPLQEKDGFYKRF